MDCPALPPGWKKEEVIRKSGLSAGKSDVYYFSPSGKKFRSKPQLARYLGNTVDLSSFDFRTGKMMPSKLQKNKQRLRNDPLNQNKGKPDLNTTLPIRQTASIFKQPVTKVTNHPSNKVKSDPQRMNEQPRQFSLIFPNGDCNFKSGTAESLAGGLYSVQMRSRSGEEESLGCFDEKGGKGSFVIA
ncbi:hypothetical protein MG293_017277 [Ovis ammon polii]|uniref:MBD domain-containing protein n=1 Tax=Ovis ammon polii TaxID=230172 RepID=A0AAD4Y2Q6_OVIAM|nr:hypothetical protein MG293_017277 [Ovis ammon polii]